MSEPATDLLLIIQLPLSWWRILLAHLQAGPFADVGNSFSAEIYKQLQPQIAEACAAQERKVIEEARNVAEAAEAAQVLRSEPAAPVDAKAVH